MIFSLAIIASGGIFISHNTTASRNTLSLSTHVKFLVPSGIEPRSPAKTEIEAENAYQFQLSAFNFMKVSCEQIELLPFFDTIVSLTR